ncbi:hypothetical protein ACBJ59_10440 [Nonomuraea sp. MTCD27]|uniref:hypothetical protein n=1 Tax=Nonomuraea sp. MTCD27 TaxID=1676747 RepID=UPI0035C06EAF
MADSSFDQRWSGDRLNQPLAVQAFTDQLRRHLSESAMWVARIRRDAEAMWKENPPDGYSSFEAWWRHGRVTSPFAEIQEHLEEAARLTFRLEARYRKHRHEIPEKRQAVAEARQQQAALPHAGVPPERTAVQQRKPPAAKRQDDDFWGSIQRGKSA